MKKLWIVLLSLFLLTGCGQKPETPVPPSDPSPTQQEPNEPPASTEPETPARAEQVDLTFFVEARKKLCLPPCMSEMGTPSIFPMRTGTPGAVHGERRPDRHLGQRLQQRCGAVCIPLWGYDGHGGAGSFAQSSGYEFEDLMGGSPGDR